jgi:hypothetical protein
VNVIGPLAGVLLLVAQGLSASAEPQVPPRRIFPVPPDRPTLVFFLQRSMNANTIVYEAALRPDGAIDDRAPLAAYWLRFNDAGERRELSFVERHFAFGPIVERDRSEKGAWTVRVAGYDRRTARLMLDRQGRPALIGQVSGRAAKLVSAYLYLDGDGGLPRVTAVDLFGIDVQTGAPLRERFAP